MRLMTKSNFDSKGLIKISEASKDDPQEIFFCIPIPIEMARNIISIRDFKSFIGDGITTKIIERKEEKIIKLNLNWKGLIQQGVQFETKINGLNIDFQLSDTNFSQDYFKRKIFKLDYSYEGEEKKLNHYNFIILEPNWKKLDYLFLEKKILFKDWND